MARIIALALGLDHDFFDKPEMLGEPIALLRPLNYEGQISVIFFTTLSQALSFICFSW